MTEKNIAEKLVDHLSEYLHHYKHLVLSKYRETKVKLSDLIKTNYELGLYHLHANNLNDAMLRFRIVLHFRSEHSGALYNLAKCLLAKGKKSDAEQKLKAALKIKPDFIEAEYLLLILHNKESKTSIPLSIVEQHYDRTAHEFDKKFSIKNGHRLPVYIAEKLSKSVDHSKKYDILDIGCGTGKCGYAVAKRISKKTMIGVDISNKMLEIAKDNAPESASLGFNKFIHSDYYKFLENTTKKFDIVLASMSLHFSNDLTKIMHNIYQIMNIDATFAFAVEKSNKDTHTKLNTSYENFCYNEKCVVDSVKESKFRIIELEDVHLVDGREVIIVICKK